MKNFSYLFFIALILMAGCKDFDNDFLIRKNLDPKTYLEDYYNNLDNSNNKIENSHNKFHSSGCSDSIVFIEGGVKTNFNIRNFLITKDDISKEKLATWLKEHEISFSDSYDEIECIHEIKHEAALEYVSDLETKDKMTLGEIKKLIAKQGGDYAKDNYNNYLDFDFSLFNNISFELSSVYKNKGDFYSIPLFRSIETKFGLTDSSIFEFHKAGLYGTTNRVIFSVKGSDGVIRYFDFSQIPPNITKVTHRLFSPL